MRRKLTDLSVTNLKPPKTGQLDITDTLLPGFTLRITSKGRRTYSLLYWFNGKKVRYTVGDAALMTLADAREAARAALRQVARGVDPAAIKKARRAGGSASDTFIAITAAYLERHLTPNTRPATIRETTRILNVDVLPLWSNRPIGEITRADVENLLDTIGGKRKGNQAKHAGQVQANRTLARLRSFFNWAVNQDIIAASPAAKVRPRIKEYARDRTLSDDEIKAFWAASTALGWPFGPLFKLLLLTAQRRAEVGRANWNEVDLENKLWTIPRERSKNGVANEVHLSAPAIEILNALPTKRGLIFSTNGARPVSGFGHAKARLDRLMNVEADFILHDLRRTATTGLAALKVPPHVADKILNHTAGTISGVAAVYNKFQYSEERKHALDAWGAYIAGLVAPRDDKKVTY
jgi:integrase